MFLSIRPIIVQLSLSLLFALSKIKKNSTIFILYLVINGIVFLFLFSLIFYCVIKNREKVPLPNAENENTYVAFGSIDFNTKRKARMSLSSLDTEQEFDYFDEINNRDSSTGVANMKLLKMK